jgi:outer membrane protein
MLGTAPHLWGQAEKMTLDEALRLALAHNQSVGAAALDVQRADDNLKAAKTQRLPSLAVSADFGEPLTRPYLDLGTGSLGSTNGAPLPAQPLRLSLTRTPSLFAVGEVEEPLSRQYQIGLEIRGLDVGRQIETERLRASRQEIGRQVRTLYAQLVENTNAVQAAAADVSLYAELERVTTIYVSEQTQLRADLLQVEARLSHAKYEQTTSENQLSTEKERLNLLMGRSVDTAFDVVPDADLNIEVPSQADALATALRLRPDLKEAQLQIDRADLDRRAKNAEYIPDVSLAATYINIAGSGLPIGGGGYAEVGVQLKWEPFDWGRKRHEAAEKAAVVSQARLTANESQGKARIEVSSALRDVLAAKQLLESVSLDEQAAEESLRVVQAKYIQRAALLDEVLKAQSACAQARVQGSHARTMIHSSTAALSKAMGEDL